MDGTQVTQPEAGRQAGRIATALSGFGPLGILAFGAIVAGNLVSTVLSAVLILAWAIFSRTPWREIGYVRPKSWIDTIAVAAVFGAAFKLLLKAVIMPLLGAPATNAKYHFLVGNTAMLPVALAMVTIGAGFAEETVYRGYLFERLGKLLGRSAAAKTAIVLLTSSVFAAAHLPDQGLPGAEQAMITGTAFGTIFFVTGEIWMVMVAHAAFDIMAVAIIYCDLEAKVAHLFFS
jgi:membrane protease YdiL (CAAX protease family)